LQLDESGSAYDDELELHKAVLAAAAEVGIRIVLINTAYTTGGVTQPLRSTQRRFSTPSLDGYLAVCEQLRTHVGALENTTMAVAPHSLRAVPVDWLHTIHEWAVAADVPVHMHVSEQIAEVDACSSIYRKRPVELLNDLGVLDARFTAVHATHLAVQEIALLARARATVCACPSTERDLGDGMLAAASLHMAGVHIAIGTDIQSVIDPFEEIRLIEYHERLRRNERVLLGTKLGDRVSVAPTLIGYGTSEGARALQLETGELADGRLADMVAVDLQHVQLAGWSLDSLDALLALSASAAVVCDVWVGGRHVIRDRSHTMAEKIVREFERVASM
jgi:formimidoylglutamate deiminase